MEKVYLLKQDFSQVIDDFPTVHKINSTDYSDLPQILASEKYEYNENKLIIARVNILLAKSCDYLVNDLNIPILSEKAMNILNIENLNEVSKIPIVLLSDTYLEELFEDSGEIKKNILKLTNFYTLKFNKQLDICNLNKSTFRKSRSKSDDMGLLRKPVLTLPRDGFPSIFKIKQAISLLFVSEETKRAFEKNGIKGCVFEEVEVTSSIENL